MLEEFPAILRIGYRPGLEFVKSGAYTDPWTAPRSKSTDLQVIERRNKHRMIQEAAHE